MRPDATYRLRKGTLLESGVVSQSAKDRRYRDVVVDVDAEIPSLDGRRDAVIVEQELLRQEAMTELAYAYRRAVLVVIVSLSFVLVGRVIQRVGDHRRPRRGRRAAGGAASVVRGPEYLVLGYHGTDPVHRQPVEGQAQLARGSDGHLGAEVGVQVDARHRR